MQLDGQCAFSWFFDEVQVYLYHLVKIYSETGQLDLKHSQLHTNTVSYGEVLTCRAIDLLSVVVHNLHHHSRKLNT